MLNAKNIPSVGETELVARFVLNSKEFRKDGTAKLEAFLPRKFPDLDTSVTRHREATDAELWREGKRVADERQPKKTLYGRADVAVATCLKEGLKVIAKPTFLNPNHADIVDWSNDKGRQKDQALALAAASTFVFTPKNVDNLIAATEESTNRNIFVELAIGLGVAVLATAAIGTILFLLR